MTPFNPDSMPPWLAKLWPSSGLPKNILAGINDDDCAVVEWGERLLVITTDFLNARPIASELGIGDLRTLGKLIVAANLSDLCGSGAKPEALLIAVTMPRTSRVSEFKKLMLGVKSEAKRWGIPVIGGDTKLGDSLAILGTAIGSAKSRANLFLKNAAEPGDLVWASGFLGSCCAAVIGLKRKDLPQRWRRSAISAVIKPDLPLTKSREVSEATLGKGGIDLSDGLGSDLTRLCKASGVGILIEAEKIPIRPFARQLARRENIPSWKLAFGIGGDFQFVVTTGRHAEPFLSRLGYAAIGVVTKERRRLLLLPKGKKIPLPELGHSDSIGSSFYDETKVLLSSLHKGARDAPN